VLDYRRRMFVRQATTHDAEGFAAGAAQL